MHSSCTRHRSLDFNRLTNDGQDMSAVLKLAEVLPQSKIQTLRCLSTTCSRSMLAPANMPAFEIDEC